MSLFNRQLSPEFAKLIRKALIALAFLSVLIVIQGFALWFFSVGGEGTVGNILEGIYFIVVGVFGETTLPSTVGGRILTVLNLFEGLILTAYFVALVAFFKLSGGTVMRKTHTEHIVICGWNFQGQLIIEELLDARSKPIVVIPGEEFPQDLKQFQSKVSVILGSPTDDNILNSANIVGAERAIILTDSSLPPDNADAKVLMITLAVETLNPKVYTCAQLMNSENAIHLKRANVDELIQFDVIGASLAAGSALNPGITKIISEFVHYNEGSELYKLNAPTHDDLVGNDFKDASAWFLERDMILIGIESDELSDSLSNDDDSLRKLVSKENGKGVYVNPRNYKIRRNDALFVLADERPVFK